MYYRYPEQIIFTKLITPLKYDEYMELRSPRLCLLELDYVCYTSVWTAPVWGYYVTAREVKVVLWGRGIGQFIFSIRKQHNVNKGTRV